MDIDFSEITACGGNCSGCAYFKSKECEGCNKNGGKCVKMWENSCKICECCREHKVLFCGLCGEFPCDWLKNTLTWEKDAIERLGECGEEYRRRSAEFNSALTSLWRAIGTHGVMTLSTCSENRVTSRSMSVVVIDGRFYCQTDENYLKCRQLSDNPNAALCYKNFSVEGICRIIGKPTEFDFFIKAIKKYYRLAAERYSVLKTECVLEITPTLVYSWNYALDKPYMQYWDFKNMLYRKEMK